MFKNLLKRIFFFNFYALTGLLLGLWIVMTSPDSQEIFYFLSDAKLYIILFLVLFVFYSWKWLLVYKGAGKQIASIIWLLIKRYIQICVVMLCSVGFYLFLFSVF